MAQPSTTHVVALRRTFSKGTCPVRHVIGYTTGATELGSCLTDLTREGSLPKSRSCGYRYVVARTRHTTIIAAF